MSSYTIREHKAKDCVQLLGESVSHSSLDDNNCRFTPERGMEETATILSEGISVLNFINMNAPVGTNTNNGAVINLNSLENNRFFEKLNGNMVSAAQPPTVPQVPISPHSIDSGNETTTHRKKRKLSRDINRPPRPVSAYFLFSNVNRTVIRHMAEQKNISYASMLREIWNDPTHTDKQYWKAKYKKMREEYKNELRIRELKERFTKQ
ncbi:HMG (high mobility group) box domain-containing protein [Ditylenchus destructor]|uniref:HMG (High mobility group) box domain-containing protein n=1 Tax=Ditylenchus destructor TaxID=166010 RepID=A0AAD4MYD0_9BILA|nr:HMG (high mobility group) box domain-containing protein [Ditylenchus destructor]